MNAQQVPPSVSGLERASGFRESRARRTPVAKELRPVVRRPRDTTPTLVDGVARSAIRTAPARDRCVLTVLAGPDAGKVFRVRGFELEVGRSSAEGQLDDPQISRHHARFLRYDGQLWVQDLDSSNGTYSGPQRVREPKRLEDGDLISLGRVTVLRVNVLDELSEQALLKVYETSLLDGLTGAYNRRYFESRLDAELAFAARHGLPLSLILFDVDEFKHINDAHGHDVGDRVLRLIAATIQRIIRPGDVFARFGGDEFVVLARSLDGRNAEILAERIRKSVQRATLHAPAGGLETTLSVGVASRLPSSGCGSAELTELADRAMYRAKLGGRNRVVATTAA